MNSAREKYELWESATTQDIMDNPEKYGAPTLEQFLKKRDYYQKQHNSVFGRIDKGGQIANRFTKKQKYELNGYRCESLEQVEQVAKDMGLNLDQIAKTYTAEFLPLGGGQADVLIKFMSPEFRAKREMKHAV